MGKEFTKKRIVTISSIIMLVITIITILSIYPKSVNKGYLEASKIYISTGKPQLAYIYLEEEYPKDGIFSKINLERKIEIRDLMIKDLEKSIESDK